MYMCLLLIELFLNMPERADEAAFYAGKRAYHENDDKYREKRIADPW